MTNQCNCYGRGAYSLDSHAPTCPVRAFSFEATQPAAERAQGGLTLPATPPDSLSREYPKDERAAFDKWHMRRTSGFRQYSVYNSVELAAAWAAWYARAILARQSTLGSEAQAEPTLIQALETGDDRESPHWFDIRPSEIAMYAEEGYKIRRLYEGAPQEQAAAPVAQEGEQSAADIFCDANCTWANHAPGCGRSADQQTSAQEGGAA